MSAEVVEKKKRCSIDSLVAIYNGLMRNGTDFSEDHEECVPLEVFVLFLVLKAMKNLARGFSTTLPIRIEEKGNRNLLRDAYSWSENDKLPSHLTVVSFASPAGNFTGRLFFDVKTNAVFMFDKWKFKDISNIANIPDCLYLQRPTDVPLFTIKPHARHYRQDLPKAPAATGEKVRIILPHPSRKLSAPQILSIRPASDNRFDIRAHRTKIVGIAEALKTLFSNLT